LCYSLFNVKYERNSFIYIAKYALIAEIIKEFEIMPVKAERTQTTLPGRVFGK
jgi:hypothetical protein